VGGLALVRQPLLDDVALKRLAVLGARRDLRDDHEHVVPGRLALVIVRRRQRESEELRALRAHLLDLAQRGGEAPGPAVDAGVAVRADYPSGAVVALQRGALLASGVELVGDLLGQRVVAAEADLDLTQEPARVP